MEYTEDNLFDTAEDYTEDNLFKDIPSTPAYTEDNLFDSVEEPSTWRQVSYGFKSGSNLTFDALDLIEIKWGDGDGYVPEDQWEGMDFEQRRQAYHEEKQRRIDVEYQDVVSQGYDDSWKALIGRGLKVGADPFLIAPGGAVAKGVYGAGKATRLAQAAYKYRKVAAAGGVYGGTASMLEQLNHEGTIDPKEVAIVTATTAVASPLLVAGVGKVGATVSKRRHNSVVKRVTGINQATDVDKLSGKEIRRIHNQIADDLIEGQTTEVPTATFSEDILAMGDHQRAVEVSRIVSNKYANILGDEKNAALFQIRSGAPLPDIDKATAVHIARARAEGPSFWRGVHQKTTGKLGKGLDWVGGGTDTRIGYLSPKVKGKIHRSDQVVMKRQNDMEGVMDGIFGGPNWKERKGAIGKVFTDKKEREELGWLMFDQKWDDVDKFISKSTASAADKQVLEETISTARYYDWLVGREAIDVGLISKPTAKYALGVGKNKPPTKQPKYREGHWGRRVKDLDGLTKRMHTMGNGKYIDDAVDEIRKKLQLKKGEPLEEFYQYQAVSKAVRMASAPRKVKMPDGSFARGYENVPKWAREFYHTPEDGMRMYFREMIEEIETRKLLGVHTMDEEVMSQATALHLQNRDSVLGELLGSTKAPNAKKRVNRIGHKKYQTGGVVDVAKLEADLPPVEAGYTRLYKAVSDKYNFEDKFTEKAYKKFKPPKNGEYLTDDLKRADAFRQKYGKSGRMEYMDIRTPALKGAKKVDGGYKLDWNRISKGMEEKGYLSADQQNELFNLINVRFGPGRRHSARWVSNAKAIVYGSLLGNVVSAAQQIGDLGVSLVVNGYIPTLHAIARRSGHAAKRGAGKLVGKDIKPYFNVMDEGIASAAHDIATGGLHKTLTRVMRYSGFTGSDRIMKNITSEAALLKAMKQVKKAGGANQIYQKYGQYWGNDDTMALIKEMRAWKRGQPLTTRMKEYAVTELTELQPVTKSALPQAYLKHPDGRLAYTLLTWQLRFLDLGRRRAMDEIRKGNVTSGISKLAYLGFTVGSMDAGVDYVQDWMRGRETRVEDFPVNAAKATASLFLHNRYGTGSKGAFSSTAEGLMPLVFFDVADTWASPFVKPFTHEEGMAEGFKEGLTDASGFVPGIGRVVQGRLGAEAYNADANNKWNKAAEEKRSPTPDLPEASLPKVSKYNRLMGGGG